MPRIEFRGKTYNNEFEMPMDIREAYKKEKERDIKKSKTGTKPLTEIVDMSPEVRAIYERALGNVAEKLDSSRSSRNLPRTEDIYRQSAPADMRDLPSDESIYRPVQPLIDPAKSAIEPEGLRMGRLVISILGVLVLAALVFFAMRFLL